LTRTCQDYFLGDIFPSDIFPSDFLSRDILHAMEIALERSVKDQFDRRDDIACKQQRKVQPK
jgi:hypothetical protein